MKNLMTALFSLIVLFSFNSELHAACSEDGSWCASGGACCSGVCKTLKCFHYCVERTCKDDNIWCKNSDNEFDHVDQYCGDDEAYCSSAYCHNDDVYYDDITVDFFCESTTCKKKTTTTKVKQEDCSDGCSNGSCIDNYDACKESKCSGGDLYCYDSNGYKQDLDDDCGEDQDGSTYYSCDGNYKVKILNILEKGCSDGECYSDWTTEELSSEYCSSGCSNGSCDISCINECPTANETKCLNSTTQQTCGNHDIDPCLEWGSSMSCDCLGGQCFTCDNECSSGDSGCNVYPTRSWTCEKDSNGCYKKDYTYCDGDDICLAGECIEDCDDDCSNTNQKKCLNDTTQQKCGDYDSDDCLEWGANMSCLCYAGSCANYDDCAEEKCNGGNVWCYDSFGDADHKSTTCSCGCTDGTCDTCCTNYCTTANETRCLNNTTQQKCSDYNSDDCLEWGASMSCQCVDNQCFTCSNECTANETGCDIFPTRSWTCTKDSNNCYKKTYKNCGSEEVCMAGECMGTCDNECTTANQTHCLNSGTQETCGDYDDDHCLEWGSVVSCLCYNNSCDGYDLCQEKKCVGNDVWCYDSFGTKKGIFADCDCGCSNGVCQPCCVENWSCEDWGICDNDMQLRVCEDSNSCGTYANKPIETQSCTADCEVLYLEWSQNEAEDGETVQMEIGTNSHCNGFFQLKIYESDGILPDDLESTMTLSFNANSYVTSVDWLVLFYKDQFAWNNIENEYYFRIYYDNHNLKSSNMLVHPRTMLEGDLVDLLVEYPLEEEECPDYGTITMSTECMMKRLEADEAPETSVMEYIQKGTIIAWVASCAICAVSLTADFVAGSACPATVGATCLAIVPITSFAVASCLICTGDWVVIGVMKANVMVSTRYWTLQTRMATFMQGKNWQLLKSKKSEVGSAISNVYKYGDDAIEEIFFFDKAVSNKIVHNTARNSISSLAGGQKVLDFHRQVVPVLRKNLKYKENQIVIKVFDQLKFADDSADIMSLLSDGRYQLDDIVDEIVIDANFGTVKSYGRFSVETVGTKVTRRIHIRPISETLYNQQTGLPIDSSFVVRFRTFLHEKIHGIDRQYIVVDLGLTPAKKNVHLEPAIEYFTDMRALKKLQGMDLENFIIVTNARIRSDFSAIGLTDGLKKWFYKDGYSQYKVLRLFNLADEVGDGDLQLSILEGVELYAKQNGLDQEWLMALFIQASNELRADAIIYGQQMFKTNPITKFYEILVYYNYISGPLALIPETVIIPDDTEPRLLDIKWDKPFTEGSASHLVIHYFDDENPLDVIVNVYYQSSGVSINQVMCTCEDSYCYCDYIAEFDCGTAGQHPLTIVLSDILSTVEKEVVINVAENPDCHDNPEAVILDIVQPDTDYEVISYDSSNEAETSSVVPSIDKAYLLNGECRTKMGWNISGANILVDDCTVDFGDGSAIQQCEFTNLNNMISHYVAEYSYDRDGQYLVEMTITLDDQVYSFSEWLTVEDCHSLERSSSNDGCSFNNSSSQMNLALLMLLCSTVLILRRRKFN